MGNCCGLSSRSASRDPKILCEAGCGRLGSEKHGNLCSFCANSLRSKDPSFNGVQQIPSEDVALAGDESALLKSDSLLNHQEAQSPSETIVNPAFARPSPPAPQVMCGTCSSLVVVPPGWPPGATVQVRCPSCGTILAVPPQVLAAFTAQAGYSVQADEEYSRSGVQRDLALDN